MTHGTQRIYVDWQHDTVGLEDGVTPWWQTAISRPGEQVNGEHCWRCWVDGVNTPTAALRRWVLQEAVDGTISRVDADVGERRIDTHRSPQSMCRNSQALDMHVHDLVHQARVSSAVAQEFEVVAGVTTRHPEHGRIRADGVQCWVQRRLDDGRSPSAK